MFKGLELKNVSFAYDNQPQVLHNLNLKLDKGFFMGMTGTNGSGKSTFAYLLNSLIPHSIPGMLSGEVFVDGISTRNKKLAYFAKKVGILFQNPDFSLFNLTVEEEILFGLENFGYPDKKERVTQTLKMVGLSGFEKKDPQTLSTGQKQKICLASLLALDAEYLVLDEPVAQLDYKSSIAMYDIFRNLHKSGKSILVIEHDTDLLYQYTNSLIILDKGNLVKEGISQNVLKEKSLLNKLGIKIPHF